MKKFLKISIFMFLFLVGFLTLRVATYAFYTDGYYLNIFYQYEDKTTAAKQYHQEFTAVEDYYVVSPTIKGYKPDKEVIEGTFTQSVSFWVTYTKCQYTLTINYVDENNNQLFDTYTNTFDYLDDYSITSPTKTGYNINYEVVSGTIEEDTTINVIYTPIEYNLTINYKDTSGNIIHNPYNGTVKYNEEYSITSPTICGYAPDKEVVSGTMTGNKEVDVIYHVLYLTLTIYYIDEDGNQLLEPSVYQLKYFESYEIVTPYIKGYHADEKNIYGNISQEDVDVIIVYHKNKTTIIAERVIIAITSFLGPDSIIVAVFYEIFRRWIFPR